jgi:hypothetical protein
VGRSTATAGVDRNAPRGRLRLGHRSSPCSGASASRDEPAHVRGARRLFFVLACSDGWILRGPGSLWWLSRPGKAGR